MPLPTQPTAKPKVEPNLKKHEEVYVSPVVDTRQQAYNTLATFPAGQKWDVDFYLRINARDTTAASFQEDQPAAWGQMRCVRGFELVVTSPLTHNQSPEDNRGWETSGSAMVYSVLTPNLGDVFVADIGSGINALFQITEVKRNTIYAESASEISYRATKQLSQETALNLQQKTIETLFFDRENFRNGLKALIRTEEVDVIRKLGRAYQRLAHLYLRDFYSTEFKTLVVPGQGVPTYDPYMTRFVRATFDTRSFPKVLEITELGVAHDPMSNQVSVLDTILRMDIGLLYSASKHAKISCIESFRARPLMNSIFFSGIKQVVTFTDIPYSVDTKNMMAHASLDFEKADTRQTGIDDILPNLNLTDNRTQLSHDVPLIHRVVQDDYYIFTEAFYDHSDGKSVLERLVYDRLEDETTNLQDLLAVAEGAARFDNLERFYYIPLIMALIKLAPGVL